MLRYTDDDQVIVVNHVEMMAVELEEVGFIDTGFLVVGFRKGA